MSAHSSPERPKVLYVLGAGRSGSTILGIALGNCGDGSVFFAGELNRWLLQSGEPSYDDEPRVAFWREVRAQMDGADDLFGFKTGCLERSSAVFKVGKWRQRARLREPYRRVAEDLYRAVAGASGASFIVDTSHYPLRARELQALTGIELHLVYLVRDPHSVVASLARKDVPERSFGLLATNAYLWLTHLFALPVFLRHPRARRLLVRHEDFRADPEGVLRQILEHAGAPPAVGNLQALSTGRALHGNRVAASAAVALEPQGERRPPRSLLTSVVQLPWRLVFARLRPAASARI